MTLLFTVSDDTYINRSIISVIFRLVHTDNKFSNMGHGEPQHLYTVEAEQTMHNTGAVMEFVSLSCLTR